MPSAAASAWLISRKIIGHRSAENSRRTWSNRLFHNALTLPLSTHISGMVASLVVSG